VVEEFMKKNPVPQITGEKGELVPLKVEWAGLMHINSVWQSEMVRGMGEALMGSFVIVFFMMMFLFRSLKWAFVAMLPLSVTIVFIYGAIGFSGKFYDMPIAVLSSLTLGLSIDFAIHFIEHVITYNKKLGSFEEVFNKMFDGTAQAIWRNVMVISIGFTPLFFAALQPYFTVGMFFFLIMLVSGVTTLLILPSILKTFNKTLLKRSE
ncbi:MAG: MMPL family transporter, partial [Bdellovibrionales bacterium]